MKLCEILEPSACRYCGIPKRGHFARCEPYFGRHEWTKPYPWQIKDRMRARRGTPAGAAWRWQR